MIISLNTSSSPNSGDLFSSNQILNDENYIVISTKDTIQVMGAKNGKLIYQKKIGSLLQPILIDNYLFIVSRNNFLISIDIINKKILYSYNINQKLSDYLKSKKKFVKIENFLMVNNNLIIFLDNSYILEFNLNGEINEIKKLPENLNSKPLISGKSFIYLNNKNRITILN